MSSNSKPQGSVILDLPLDSHDPSVNPADPASSTSGSLQYKLTHFAWHTSDDSERTALESKVADAVSLCRARYEDYLATRLLTELMRQGHPDKREAMAEETLRGKIVKRDGQTLLAQLSRQLQNDPDLGGSIVVGRGSRPEYGELGGSAVSDGDIGLARDHLDGCFVDGDTAKYVVYAIVPTNKDDMSAWISPLRPVGSEATCDPVKEALAVRGADNKLTQAFQSAASTVKAVWHALEHPLEQRPSHMTEYLESMPTRLDTKKIGAKSKMMQDFAIVKANEVVSELLCRSDGGLASEFVKAKGAVYADPKTSLVSSGDLISLEDESRLAISKLMRDREGYMKRAVESLSSDHSAVGTTENYADWKLSVEQRFADLQQALSAERARGKVLESKVEQLQNEVQSLT